MSQLLQDDVDDFYELPQDNEVAHQEIQQRNIRRDNSYNSNYADGSDSHRAREENRSRHEHRERGDKRSDGTRRRGRSPHRTRQSMVNPRGDLFLKIGQIRSDPSLDATLRRLTRAHRDNEHIVIGMMRCVKDQGVEVTLPGAITQKACDVVWRLLQMDDDDDGRKGARDILSELISAEDLLNVCLVLLHFTRAQDSVSLSVMIQALLVAPGDDHGDDVARRILDGVITEGAVPAAGDTLMACALHTAFGISTLGILITGEDGLPILSFPEGATDKLEVQLEEVTRQAAGMFKQCSSVQYDLAAVHALASMVVALDAEENEEEHRSLLFLAALDQAATVHETTLDHTRHRNRYRRGCDAIASTLVPGARLEWLS
jgi:hypothetical protein